MAFPLKDVRFTTRRTAGREPEVYPRLFRDRSMLPRIDIAVRYFESMLGRERREFEPEVLVHFFGDFKLARCMIACLARSYRFQAPDLAEVLGPAARDRLAAAGLDSPRALRLWLYDRLNDFGFGFLHPDERDRTLGRLAAELDLAGVDLERLLYLDADEHAVLGRLGAEPRPEDVLAQYNFGVLESLLRHAERVELALAGWTSESLRATQALCAANDIDAELREGRARSHLTLFGRPDALGVWTRHGRRLARTLVQLLERGRPSVVDGVALVVLRDRRVRLRLTPEALDLLVGPAPSAGWADLPGWDAAALGEALRAGRGTAGRAASGWSLRRLPEPQAWAAGVIVPDLLLAADTRRLLVVAVRSPGHGARLAPIARTADTGEPLLFVGTHDAVGPLRSVGAMVVATPWFEVDAVVAALDGPLAPLGEVRPVRVAAF